MKEMKNSNDVHSLFDRKLAYLNQYLTITRQMRDVLETEAERKLTTLSAQRQYCVQRIDKIDAAISRLTGAREGQKNSVQGRMRSISMAYLDEVKNMLLTISPLEKELGRAVKEKHANLLGEILRLKHGRKAVVGYGQKQKCGSKFINIQN